MTRIQFATPTVVKHDRATCGICRQLASGLTHVLKGIGKGNVIPPYCERCDGHHHGEWHRVGPRPNDSKSLCPRCRLNLREVEHVPEAFQSDRKRYAAYCAPCLEDQGYVYFKATDVIGWWEQRSTQRIFDTVPDEDIFDSLNGVSGVRVSS